MSDNSIPAAESSSWLAHRFATLVLERGAPSMLDIGCGAGITLAQASEAGVQVFGVEGDFSLRNAARLRCPGAYVAATVEEIPPHRFDVILVSASSGLVAELYAIFYELAAKSAFGPETVVIAPESDARTGTVLEALFRHLRFGKVARLLEPSGWRYEASGSEFPKFIQERYVPGTWSEIAAYEHMPRYAYARNFATGARVLDFGCGSGYGTACLADVAESVVGLDISEDALAYARDCHQHPHLTFLHDDRLGGALPDRSFDLIVCFEVIEHLDGPMQVELLAGFRRLLAPAGRLLISTPNPQVTALYGANPYHLRELTESQFEALLREHFPHVGLVEQSIHASVFLQPRKSEGVSEVRNDAPGMTGPQRPAIYIGICSLEQMPPIPSVVYPDRARNYIGMRVEALARRNQHLIERHGLIQAHAARQVAEEKVCGLLDDRRRLETELAETLDRLLNDQQHLQRKLAALQNEYEVQSQKLQQTTQCLTEIEASTSWRMIRRAMPLLAKMRPVLRPALRAIWRLRHPPVPDDLMQETFLDPTWDAENDVFTLEFDKDTPQPETPGGFIAPYVVRPIYPVDNTKPRPKILHVIPNVFVGGSTQLVIDLVQHLSPFFLHEVMTCALWPGGAHEGLDVHHVPTPSSKQVAEVIDKVRPDLVHVHYWGLMDEPWYNAVIDALRKSPIPVVQNVNTPIAPRADEIFSHYVFVSEYVRKTFGKNVSGRQTSVIYPGIDLDLFGEFAPADDRENAIGMVYRLEGDKLTEDAIDLFIEVVRRRPRTKVFIIGGGSFLQPYLERTKRAGVRQNFRFTGYVPYHTLPLWYNKFSIFVAPVWKESFGQVAPFAMRKQIVVAGYAVGALPEILGSSETLGTSLDEAAAIIVALLDDPDRLSQLGHRNQVRATELFAVETMVARYREVYESLLAQPKKYSP
jgi:2-polyprenyl-3-methyl-5-hydroxy-6-metoxy-1,4-benzoquinol methylase/glycosyltransferase involved in cell wall biosynthesis